tara:strand:+ start:49 stop:762 length:714 start_codon:yes stop_codon:yes gene_type:complete
VLDTNLLERRINCRNFRTDKYPSKEKIQEVIQEAINVAPVKSEVFDFRLEIWGPEHTKVKEDLMWSTVTKHPYRLGESHYPDYDTWLAETKKYYKTHPQNFNTQVQAPYLFVLVEDKSSWTGGQPLVVEDWRSYMNAGIWLYALALAANRHEIDTSYCICCGVSRKNPIQRGYSIKKYPRILAMMGVGYFDFDKKSLFKRDGDWIEHVDGGSYNIVTRKRNGYKSRKPNHDDLTVWK